MSFTKVVAALAALSLAAAAPKPHCTTYQSCTAVASSPAPENVYCAAIGQVHLVPGVILGDVTTKGSTASDCAQSCLQNEQCHSIAFDADRQRCLTFSEVPAQMGFREEDSADFAFWNKACWNEKCETAPKCTPSAKPTTA